MGHIQLSREADLRGRGAGDRRPDGADGRRPRRRSRLDAAAGLRQAGAGRAGDEPADVGASRDAGATWRDAASDGVRTVGPNDGDMACGEFGPGRMAEPQEILAAIELALAPPAPVGRAARRWSPAARPASRSTRSAIFPTIPPAARAMPSPSVGRGRCRRHAGQRARYRSPTPPGVTRRRTSRSAREMLAAVEAALPADIAVCAAAVADWRPAQLPTARSRSGQAGRRPRSS